MQATTQQFAKTRLSMPKLLLHAEGLAIFATALIVYGRGGWSWWWFAGLLLAPDLAMVGYLANTRVGSILYNFAHTYTLPLLVTTLSFITDSAVGMQLGIIWLAHIGMDRTVGYGLKYPEAFRTTHLDRV